MKTIDKLNEVSKFLEDQLIIELDQFYSVRCSDTIDLQGRFASGISKRLFDKQIPADIDGNGYLNAKIGYTLSDQSEVTIRIILT